MQVEDGTGGGYKMKVSKENQAQVRAVTASELVHASQNDGSAFNWSSGTIDIDAADTVILVKNTSDINLHVECIKISNGSVASEYTVHLPTTEVTVTGTTVTGTNLNTASSNVANASAVSDETNNSQGNIIETVYLPVDSGKAIETPGLILGKNKSVAVDVVENTAESACTIIGHFGE